MLRSNAVVALIAILASILVPRHSDGQSGSRPRVERKLSAQEFQRRLWEYLTEGRSAYKSWGPFTGKNAGIYEGRSPHGAYLKMYANRIARQNPESLPNKSIIVQENYAGDQKTLTEVTVMYRTLGYNPDHYDWYWIKYLPDGTVATTPPEKGRRPIAGRIASCIECHASAVGEDYVFAND